jgi:predicted kinase
MQTPTLHLVCGIPGAGKTTFAKQLETEFLALRLCPDEWMTALNVDLFDEVFRDKLEQRLMLIAKNVLLQQGQVIIEFGSWARVEREHLLLLAQAAKAKAFLYWLDAPVSELARRIAVRQGADAAYLNESALQEISDRVERPSLEEGTLFDAFQVIGV